MSWLGCSSIFFGGVLVVTSNDSQVYNDPINVMMTCKRQQRLSCVSWLPQVQAPPPGARCRPPTCNWYASASSPAPPAALISWCCRFSRFCNSMARLVCVPKVVHSLEIGTQKEAAGEFRPVRIRLATNCSHDRTSFGSSWLIVADSGAPLMFKTNSRATMNQVVQRKNTRKPL